MKNIHILPTDQPSRLVKIKDTFFLTTTDDIPGGTFYNIHITNDEEIGEGDWCLNANKDTIYKKDKYPMDISWYKIILTTDTTLIADGVQDIDDEFLYWFVKNSSCEFVEVKMEAKKQLVNGYKNQPDNVIGFIAEYENVVVPKLDENGCLILKKK